MLLALDQLTTAYPVTCRESGEGNHKLEIREFLLSILSVIPIYL